MNICPTQNFTADGFSGSKGQEFHAAVAAASGRTSGLSQPRAENQRRRATDVEQIYHNQDGYDEGMVHSHGWAAAEA